MHPANGVGVGVGVGGAVVAVVVGEVVGTGQVSVVLVRFTHVVLQFPVVSQVWDEKVYAVDSERGSQKSVFPVTLCKKVLS